jgi:hypothetical protein
LIHIVLLELTTVNLTRVASSRPDDLTCAADSLAGTRNPNDSS